MFFFLKLEKLKTLEKVDILPRFHPDFLVGQILIEKNDPSLLVDGAKSDQHRLYTPTKAKNRPKNFGSVPPHPGNYYQAQKMTFFADYKSKLPATTGSRTPYEIFMGAFRGLTGRKTMFQFTNSYPQTKAY